MLLAVALIVISVVVVGLSFYQPWSRIKVQIYNADDFSTLTVVVYIDGIQKAMNEIEPGQHATLGVWSVHSGRHVISLDGYWSWLFTSLGELDGIYDWSQSHEVEPLFTQNVYFRLSWLEYPEFPVLP